MAFAGEEATKVDDVEHVVEILTIGLEVYLHPFTRVEIEASRGTDLERRKDAAPIKS